MSILKVTGESSDGKLIIDGIWKLYESHGVPLDVIFEYCMNNKSIPDWICLYKQMIKSGISHDRCLSKLDEAICDSMGMETSKEVIKRLDLIFNSSLNREVSNKKLIELGYTIKENK